jgi:ElaB/YqjD/DUF883 family membrane-anchored ribosome-binding protein
MKISTVSEAAKAGQRAIHDLKLSRDTVSETWEDGRAAAERFIGETRDRVEDLVYQATRKIKRSPLAAVAFAFGVGALLGVTLSRNARR